MTRSLWAKRLAVSAVVYVVTRLLFDYLFLHHPLAPGRIPGILLAWLFFAIGYFSWDRYLAKKRVNGRGA